MPTFLTDRYQSAGRWKRSLHHKLALSPAPLHWVVMRIVGFDEFCSLPDGTVFSYWRPCIVSGLYRRGEVISYDGGPRDFFEASLTAESYNGELPVVDLIESRWGIFDYDQQFVVYGKDDIDVIAEGLGIKSA